MYIYIYIYINVYVYIYIYVFIRISTILAFNIVLVYNNVFDDMLVFSRAHNCICAALRRTIVGCWCCEERVAAKAVAAKVFANVFANYERHDEYSSHLSLYMYMHIYIYMLICLSFRPKCSSFLFSVFKNIQK